jgi:transcriptional regulator with XRE-family HTH domain
MGIRENIRDAKENNWLMKGVSLTEIEAMRRITGIAADIYKARKSKGWTEKELAGRLGVSEDTVLAWEDADTDIDAQTLDMIAKALDIRIPNVAVQTANDAWREKDKLNEAVIS